MNYRRARNLNRIISLILVPLFFLILIFLKFYEIQLVLFIVFCTLFFLNLLNLFLFFRCPQCDGALPVRLFAIPDCCPHCGKELNAKS